MRNLRDLKEIWEDLRIEEASIKVEGFHNYYREGLSNTAGFDKASINEPYQKQLREERN